MITAVIAEKPSVAKDIANVLNVRERHDGYLSGNGYLVTGRSAISSSSPCPKHTATRASGVRTCPFCRRSSKYIPRQIREGKEYKPDPGVLKQLKVIRGGFRPFRPYRRGDRRRA